MLQMAFGYGGRPLVFIRFNPDPFKIKGKTFRISRFDREEKLLDLLQAGLYYEDMEHLITIHYICYNNDKDDSIVQTLKFTNAEAYEAWVEETAPAF
jgi:hypothetical protein